MRVQTQFSIFLVNKPGVLAHITNALAKARINVIALTLVDSSEHGVLRIVCADESEKVSRVLGKAYDQFTETDILTMEIANKPGVFSAVAEKLADAHININYAYCTGGVRGGKTTAIFKVADLKKALRVLKQTKSPGKDGRTTVKAPPQRRR